MSKIHAEIVTHPFQDDPLSILKEYPGVEQQLKQRVEKTRDVLSWRELDTLIQYAGYTCNLNLHWRYSKGSFKVESVRMFRVCKAPPKEDQMELLT